MSEWLTYRLQDFLLFSPRTYERLIETYNRDVWPGHVLAILSGIAILVAMFRREGKWPSRVAGSLLAIAWIWVAWAFHMQRYEPINWAAKWFAAGFVLQALLLAWVGIVKGRLAFTPDSVWLRAAGLTVVLFGLAGLPLLQRALGRPWSRVEIFGLFPDATAVATMGVLLAASRTPWASLVIPLLWCAIGGATLHAMQRPDALLSPAAGLAVLGLVILKTTLARRAPTPSRD